MDVLASLSGEYVKINFWFGDVPYNNSCCHFFLSFAQTETPYPLNTNFPSSPLPHPLATAVLLSVCYELTTLGTA